MSYVVEHSKHGNESVRRSIRASYVRSSGTYVVNGQSDATGLLRDHRRGLECIVYSNYTIILHCHQKTTGVLWKSRSGVEQRRRGVREQLERHQIVRLENRWQITAMDSDCDAHQQVLRSLDDLAVDLEQVRVLQRLETC